MSTELRDRFESCSRNCGEMELQGEKYGPTECSSRTRSSPSAGACPASTGRNAAAKERRRTQLIVEPACGSNDNGGNAHCSQVNARKYGRWACIHTRDG